MYERERERDLAKGWVVFNPDSRENQVYEPIISAQNLAVHW